MTTAQVVRDACAAWQPSSINRMRPTPEYMPMAPAYDGIAFQAALRPGAQGARTAQSGYTEPLLHARGVKELKRACSRSPDKAGMHGGDDSSPYFRLQGR